MLDLRRGVTDPETICVDLEIHQFLAFPYVPIGSGAPLAPLGVIPSSGASLALGGILVSTAHLATRRRGDEALACSVYAPSGVDHPLPYGGGHDPSFAISSTEAIVQGDVLAETTT